MLHALYASYSMRRMAVTEYFGTQRMTARFTFDDTEQIKTCFRLTQDGRVVTLAYLLERAAFE